MRFSSFSQLFGKHWRQERGKARRHTPRRLRPRRLTLETLEDRTVPSAALPAATVAGASYLFAPSSALPGIGAQAAMDPLNPRHEAVVSSSISVNNGMVHYALLGAYTIDAGQNWSRFSIPGTLLDPASPVVAPYTYFQATDPSIAFDSSGNFYVAAFQHSPVYDSGSLAFLSGPVSRDPRNPPAGQ